MLFAPSPRPAAARVHRQPARPPAFRPAFRPALLLAALLVLPPLAPLGGCATNPATGEKQLQVLSKEEEISIGEDAAPKFLKEGGGEIPDEQIQKYVSDLGARLAAVSERPDLPWAFYTLDSAVINAFALPGGKVFVSRGLMEKMDNEAQLAGVLGHEVGHVTAKHINDRMAQALGISVATAAIGVAAQVSEEEWVRVLGAGVGVGGQLFALKFSRSDELQADALGVRYMSQIDYNPVGQLQLMQILKRASGGGGIELLQTHPLPSTRIDRLENLIGEKYPRADETGAYVFGHDRFEKNVLARLEKLPPAKHGQQGQALLTPELIQEHGVLVCGGGPAGFCAALAAA
ncbi:MAG: M48 family metalloprotease, partial [Phycisphaeraceae bacterium]